MYKIQIPQSFINQQQFAALQTSYSTEISDNTIVFHVENLSVLDQTMKDLQIDSIVKIELSINGLSCDGCANSASRILNLQNGVIHASVDFKQSNATIYYVRDAVSLKELNDAVELMGYKLSI